MSKVAKIILYTASIILATGSLAADDEKKNTWTGNIDVNALFAAGNSSQTSFGLAGKASYRTKATSHTFTGYADFNKSAGVTDRERYGGGYNLRYDFSSRIFFTLDSSFDSNKFGAFRERLSVAGGVGYRLYDKENIRWTLEAAPSLLYTKPIAGAEFVSEFSAFGRSIVDWQISKTTNIDNATSVHFGKNTVFENKTAVSFQIFQALSSKLSYDILYTQNAPADRKSTDTIVRIGLSYGF